MLFPCRLKIELLVNFSKLLFPLVSLDITKATEIASVLLKLLIFYDFFDFLIHAYSGNLQKSIHFLIVFSMNFA